MQALEAVFAKGAAGSVLSRKRSHVLLDDVAFHRERKVARQKMFKRVQLEVESMSIVRVKWLTT